MIFLTLTVGGLAGQRRKAIPGKTLEATVFSLPSNAEEMKSFVDKYNKNQEQLQALSAMDDLLSGKS